MRERTIEKYLVDVVNTLGGECWKWSGRIGVPDRICFFPGGRVVFVEVKQKTGRLSKMQMHIHEKLRNLGMDVRVVWSKDDVDELVRQIF